MNRGFGFMLAVPIFIAAILVLMMTIYVRDEQEDFDEYVLSYQTDYATDAAVMQLIEGGHLGLDYQDWSRVAIAPDDALKVFESCMLTNLGYPLTDDAYAEFSMNYMPLFCVCAYDGYYVYQLQKDGQVWHFVATPKIPYTFVDEITGAHYSLNLGVTNVRKLLDGRLTLEQMDTEGITVAQARYKINSLVSDDLMVRFAQYQRDSEASHVNIGGTFYIPQGMTTMTQVNAIEGPTVIALIDNWQQYSVKELSSFSIGGARIEQTRQVALFRDASGKKWYAYADLIPDGMAIEDMVPGVQQAAEKGYHYSYDFMG